MKFALASDLHIEFGDVNIRNTENSDLLILAGDITIVNSLKMNDPTVDTKMGRTNRYTKSLFDTVSQEFPHVVVVMGNHEFYNGRWVEYIEYYRNYLAQWPNVHLLECNTLELPWVTVLGSTLWTDLQHGDPIVCWDVQNSMNDYHTIRVDTEQYRKLMPLHTIARHHESLEWLKRQLAVCDSGKPVIVVTHHAPSSQSVAQQYRGDRANAAYYSNLEGVILDHPQIAYWCHGHMHNYNRYQIGGTTVLSNPRGYKNFELIADTWALKYIEI